MSEADNRRQIVQATVLQWVAGLLVVIIGGAGGSWLGNYWTRADPAIALNQQMRHLADTVANQGRQMQAQSQRTSVQIQALAKQIDLRLLKAVADQRFARENDRIATNNQRITANRKAIQTLQNSLYHDTSCVYRAPRGPPYRYALAPFVPILPGVDSG